LLQGSNSCGHKHEDDQEGNDEVVADLHAGMRNNPKYHSLWGTN